MWLYLFQGWVTPLKGYITVVLQILKILIVEVLEDI